MLAELEGMESLRQKCKHFGTWIDTLVMIKK